MLKSVLSLALALAISPMALAADAPAATGEVYDIVAPPHPTADPTKVEVMEFFWYGCPHCYHFEPHVKSWLKTKPANVEFIRQPAVFNAHWAAHAKAFFTAEALGVLDKVHDDFYDRIQNKKEPLESEDDLAKFFAEHGVKEADFRQAYKSFAVDAKMRQAEPLAASYGVDGTPAIIVNGKYRISASKAKSFDKMIETTNALVAKELAALPAAKPAPVAAPAETAKPAEEAAKPAEPAASKQKGHAKHK
jgi:thiol:disulfide interchange protein DsbA